MNQSIKLILKLFIHVISIVVFAEAAYWMSGDLVIYNEDIFNKNIEFLYYTMPAFVAIMLTLLIYLKYNNISNYFKNLILVLINTYCFLCIIMLTSGYCDFKKNLDIFYSAIVASILIVVAYILLKKIVPKMSIKNIIIVILSTIIALFDFLVSLIGYQLFYPENW